MEPAPAGGASDIVRYDAATGARTVLVPGARLLPPGRTTALGISDYAWSPDSQWVAYSVVEPSRNSRIWLYHLPTRKKLAARSCGAISGYKPQTLHLRLRPEYS